MGCIGLSLNWWMWRNESLERDKSISQKWIFKKKDQKEKKSGVTWVDLESYEKSRVRKHLYLTYSINEPFGLGLWVTELISTSDTHQFSLPNQPLAFLLNQGYNQDEQCGGLHCGCFRTTIRVIQILRLPQYVLNNTSKCHESYVFVCFWLTPEIACPHFLNLEKLTWSNGEKNKSCMENMPIFFKNSSITQLQKFGRYPWVKQQVNTNIVEFKRSTAGCNQ